MIKKLTDAEYLKRMTSMTLAEKISYGERVGRWLDTQTPLLSEKLLQPGADYQNVIQCSAEWNDAEVAAFEEGARLLTALTGTVDTWLPEMLYVKSSKRVLRRLFACMASVSAAADVASVNRKRKEQEQERRESAEAPADPGKTAPSGKQQPASDGQCPEKNGSPVRPKHIDQYVHLMPAATQKKAEKVKALLDSMDYHREQARLLMSDGDSVARAQHMKEVTKADTQLRKIYNELDAEWDKLVKSGKVVVDGLGNARVIEGKGEEPGEPSEPKAQVQEPEEKTALTPEQRERVRTLRHFLKDTRRGNGRTRDEHVKKWKAFYDEMISIAGPSSVTDKVKEAAQHYGITIQ